MLTFFYTTGFGGSANLGFFIVPGLPRPIMAASEFLKSSPSLGGSGLARGLGLSSTLAGGNLGFSMILGLSSTLTGGNLGFS